MMKNESKPLYESPVMDIICFEEEDIITTSNFFDGDGEALDIDLPKVEL